MTETAVCCLHTQRTFRFQAAVLYERTHIGLRMWSDRFLERNSGSDGYAKAENYLYEIKPFETVQPRPDL